MPNSDLFTVPLTILPRRDAVFVSSPDGREIAALTPAAALASAARLRAAARLAMSGALSPIADDL